MRKVFFCACVIGKSTTLVSSKIFKKDRKRVRVKLLVSMKGEGCIKAEPRGTFLHADIRSGYLYGCGYTAITEETQTCHYLTGMKGREHQSYTR